MSTRKFSKSLKRWFGVIYNSSMSRVRNSKISCCEIPNNNQKARKLRENKPEIDVQFCRADLTCNKPTYSYGFGMCNIKGDSKDVERLQSLIRLVDLKKGHSGKVVLVKGSYKVIRRLLDMGIIPGTTVSLIKIAPLGGAVEIVVRGSNLALSRNISDNVFVEPI
jgi:Fe2+ transport system protein FeoA